MHPCLANLPCQYNAMSHVHCEQLTAPHVNGLSEYNLDGIDILEVTYVALHMSFCAIVRKLRCREDVTYVTNTAYGATNKQPSS